MRKNHGQARYKWGCDGSTTTPPPDLQVPAHLSACLAPVSPPAINRDFSIYTIKGKRQRQEAEASWPLPLCLCLYPIWCKSWNICFFYISMSVCLGCCVCCFSSCEQLHAHVCLFGVCLFGRLLNNCWRPYHVKCTGSLLTSEVKRHRARLVLGWGTAWEDLRVLSALSLHALF